jgi:hypothetical protein
MAIEARFPTAAFVRRGPPVAVQELDRATHEKWSRVMVVAPTPSGEVGGRKLHDFTQKGPYVLPLAVRREGSDTGSRDAWMFFTHPYSVFPQDGTYFNVSGQGCLGARIYLRAEEGVQIYDEVGAGIPGSEMVSDSFPGAMGVLRRRALGDGKGAVTTPFARDLLELDLDLLEVLRLSTFLLQTRSPKNVLSDLHALLMKPTVKAFAWEAFDEDDHETMADAADGGSAALEIRALRFRVEEGDFTTLADVRDAQNRQAIHELLQEFQAWEETNGELIRELGLGIHQAEANLAEIKDRVKKLRDGATGQGRVSRFFSRSDQTLKELKAEAVRNLRSKRDFEEKFHQIPGYDRLAGLSDRVQGFQGSIKTIYRLGHDLFDHNVTQSQLQSLRAIVIDKIDSAEPAQQRSGYKQYDLRLRAEILHRVLTTYSLSAYVLRRPDALRGGHSLGNIKRINHLARNLIEYFRYVRYGPHTLGDAFDETWGQVLNLEAHL